MLPEIDDAQVRKIVARFSSALEDGDANTLVALLTEAVSWSMPPLPHWYRGIPAVMDHAIRAPLAHLAWSINVLTVRDERIAEITSSTRTLRATDVSAPRSTETGCPHRRNGSFSE